MKIGSQAGDGKSPRRQPPSGGYARGAEQRARIIQAALKVFGEEGYERASTRLIAREAGIQPPALQYYFDSKEGLNRACAEYLVDLVIQSLGGALEIARATPDDASPQVALDALCDLMDALVDISLFSREAPERARFSARAQSDNSPAAQVMRDRIASPIYDAAARLVARALGVPPGTKPDDNVWLRTHLLLSQMASLHTHRDKVLAKLGWPDFDGPRRAMIKAMLRLHTQGALTAPWSGDAAAL